jgi:amino acid transporter
VLFRSSDWLLPAPACQQASHRYAHFLIGEGDLQQVIPDILLGKGDIPRLVIIGVSVTGALLVLLNVGLVACFIYRKRKKRLREGTVGSVLGESMSRFHNELAFGLSWASIFLKVEISSVEHVIRYLLGRKILTS